MKKRLTGYSFDASAKTVTHADFSDITLAGIQMIVNVTDQVIIYNFADTAKGGTLSTDTLTLEYDTASMSDTDELMILVEDGSTTQSVSGTVTANLSATDNAVLDDIALDTEAIKTSVASLDTKIDTVTTPSDTQPVSAVSLPLPSGAATSAKQDTGNTSLSSIDGKVPALGQALAAGSVPVVLPAAQVSTLTPPAAITGYATETTLGTVHGHVDSLDTKIGEVQASPTANTLLARLKDLMTGIVLSAGSAIIGKVGIDQTTPGTTNKVSLGSDVVHTIVDSGSTVVTQGTATNLKTQAENYQGGSAVSAANPLQVTLANGSVPSHAVTNAGTFAVQATCAANSGVDIGDVTINNASGAGAVNIQDGGNSITVDGTVSANATLAAETTKVIGTVNIASGQTVGLAAGSAAIGKLAANSGVDIGDVDVTSLPALTAGTNAIGKLLPPDIDVTAHTNYARKYYTNTGAVTDGIVWSPAAGKRWHITSIYFQVSADCTVTFEDDKAGGDDPVLKGEYKAGSGVALSFDEKYPMASGEDAADLLVTTSAGNIYITVVGYEI